MLDKKSGTDVLEAIANRFSVRKYTDEPLTDEELDVLLNAAFCAPSACNRRPWELVVVRDRDTLREFSDRALYQKMLRQAPAAIVVCGDTNVTKIHDLLVNDCSAAVQNILLAAYGTGLGACWCGLADPELAEWFRVRLGMPENVLPAALVAVGHTDAKRTQPDRFTPEHVHFEHWNGRK